MAKGKQVSVDEELLSVFANTKPINPAPSVADKAYLKSLKKRGYTETEIIQIAATAGFKISPDLFVSKPKQTKKETSQVKQ